MDRNGCNDWSWSEGEIIDAAASGSEMELEVSSGNYWIHIISWNGEEESSSDFGLTSEDDGECGTWDLPV